MLKNSKSQAPNHKQIPNPNFKTNLFLKKAFLVNICAKNLFWTLEF
jgi:hypothetical protein